MYKSGLVGQMWRRQFCCNSVKMHQQQQQQKPPINTFEMPKSMVNRNTRSLERIRVGHKPSGYHLEAPGYRYWNKVTLDVRARGVTAAIQHYDSGVILRISTNDWPLRRQLYSSTDRSAYQNLGRVCASICLRTGITQVYTEHLPDPVEQPDKKSSVFLRELEAGGVALHEPPQYLADQPWDLQRKEKPWLTHL